MLRRRDLDAGLDVPEPCIVIGACGKREPCHPTRRRRSVTADLCALGSTADSHRSEGQQSTTARRRFRAGSGGFFAVARSIPGNVPRLELEATIAGLSRWSLVVAGGALSAASRSSLHDGLGSLQGPPPGVRVGRLDRRLGGQVRSRSIASLRVSTSRRFNAVERDDHRERSQPAE